MKLKDIKELAHKFHTPGATISERWNPAYIAECKKINRSHLEKEIMNKHNAHRKINKEVKRSKLHL